MNNEIKQCQIAVELENLTETYSATEIEDCVFDVFQTAYIEVDIDKAEREKRSLIHSVLRNVMRNCKNCITQNPELCTEIK